MGNAKLAKNEIERIEPLVKDISIALQKLARASSSHIGSDCILHAEIGRCLLKDVGIEVSTKAGYAAWRVGNGDGDVISHVNNVKGFLPDGAKGFQYHVWLTTSYNNIIDFSTYQLKKKASDLDKMDGGHTNVEWCPDYLLANRNQISTYEDVAKLHTGLFYYEEQQKILKFLMESFSLDSDDLEIARTIFRNKDIVVIGPNMLG